MPVVVPGPHFLIPLTRGFGAAAGPLAPARGGALPGRSILYTLLSFFSRRR